MEPDDGELYRLYYSGRAREALARAQARIGTGPSGCHLYRALSLAAVATGDIAEVADQLLRLLRDRPGDDFLLFGAALALQELHQDEPAFNLMAGGVQRGVPCTDAYVGFVDLGRRVGRAREVETVLLAKRRASSFFQFARGYYLDTRGEGLSALTTYDRAVGVRPALAVAHLRKARLLLEMGRFAPMLSAVETGTVVARRSGRLDLEAELGGLAAFALHQLGREPESEQEFQRALAKARAVSRADLEARLLLGRASLMGASGKAERLAQHIAEARACEPRLRSASARAVYFNGLGRVLAGAGEERLSRTSFEKSIELARAEKAPLLEQEGRIQLVRLALKRGETAGALQDLEEALSVSRRLEDGQLEAQALSALADAHERMGGYRKALGYYQRAHGLAQRAANRRAQAVALGNMGLVLFRLGIFDEAARYTGQASRMARETQDLKLETSLLQARAASLTGLGRYAEAEQAYRAAWDSASRLAPASLRALVLAGWARVTLLLGQEGDARPRFEEALQLARVSNDALVEWQALAGLGACARLRGDREQAAAVLERAIDRVETVRAGIKTDADRMSFLETRADIYRSLAAVLAEQELREPGRGYALRAFEVAEQLRARVILDILSTSRAALPQADSRPRTLGAEQVRRALLRPGELLLEFQLGEPRSFLLALSESRSEVHELPGKSELAALTRAFLATAGAPPRSPENPFSRHLGPARALFAALLGPVGGLLTRARHLVIAPDGLLYHLPFEALIPSKGEPHYLGELVTISYVPSASVLGELRARARSRTRGRAFLGVAQPEGRLSDSEPFPRIPFAAEEVEALSELFPAASRRALIGREATEAAVKEAVGEPYRFLHFAAHAVVDEASPGRSALLLGRDENEAEDGLLRMAEVLDLRLDADLVVLSACQTGLGRLLSAEGTLGFTWSFLSAGSSAVVVSLWKVNDRSTAEMMRAFYQGLGRGEPTAEALRGARRHMRGSDRDAFRHPYYWATFVLVGLPE
jgi:tetratricopeptide (TPR) repeat protein